MPPFLPKKVLTSEGLAALITHARAHAKERGLQWADSFRDEEWHQAKRQELTADKHQGRYWKWGDSLRENI